MSQIIEYVKPELLVVAVALYFIGMSIKNTQAIKDKYIPSILGVIGIVLCALWVFSTTTTTGSQQIALAIFTSIIQGVLVAGLSTYVNQIIKQTKKGE